MASEPIQIKRYPNRRYYARNTSKYVSLQEIEQMIQAGNTVEIRDSQTGEDLTRAVLTQIIIERQPEKMLLFPTDMLHFILQSNDMMSGFLRDYFRHSLTYLQYLRQHSTAAPSLTQPMHWIKAWLDGISPQPTAAPEPSANAPAAAQPVPLAADDAHTASGDSGTNAEASDPLAQRIEQLEQRLRQLEGQGPES